MSLFKYLSVSSKVGNLPAISREVLLRKVESSHISEVGSPRVLSFEKTFFLNHLSYFALSNGLVEKLENSDDPRIINVASNAHKRYNIDINDLESENNYSGWKAYCRSKLLNIFFTYSFKEKIKTKINSNCLHPGFVNSNFGNNNQNFYRFLINFLKNLLAIKTDKAALSPLNLALNDDYKDVNGKYFFKLKEKKSSKESYNIELANQIWNKSLEYLK